MKRTVIGVTLLVCGLAAVFALIDAAVQILPTLGGWSTSYPSRLLYVVFSGMNPYDATSQGLALGWLFVVGCAMALAGLAVLAVEYFRKERDGQ